MLSNGGKTSQRRTEVRNKCKDMYRTSEQRCNKSLKCLHIHQALEVLGADECLRQGQELQVKNLRLGRQTDKLYKQGLLKTV